MGDIEYDLNTSGGLMDQIQALLAPPTNEPIIIKNHKEPSKHPYYRRPGKGHNHDNCDACNEGGDLICCDKCPASFHLQCHDPPLDEEDIPQGQWLCHTCRKNAENKSKSATNHENDESHGGESPRKRLRNSRSLSTSSISSTSGASVPGPGSTSSKPPTKKQKANPMEVLVQAASVLNPKQFELPRSLNVPCPFPGTDKVEVHTQRNKRPTQRSNGKPRKQHELQPGGIVPLPARTCFECGRSCRVAPLLACDYCPLLFHLDCLDPPLTAFPGGRWMCPNHVEQYIDSKLVTSVSATERVKLWDRFTGPIDQDAIKTEFIRKAHRKNPPFRIKVNLGTRSRVRVPGIVRYHYKHPVDLLPSLRDIRRIQSVLNRRQSPLYNHLQLDDSDILYHDQLEKMNLDLMMCYNNKMETSSQDSGIAGTDFDNCNDLSNGNGVKASLGDSNIQQWNINGRRSSNESEGSDDTNISSQILAALGSDAKLPDVVANINQDVDRELKQLDDRLVRFLAYQRLQQLSNSDLPDLNLKQNSKPPKHMPLPSELLTPADIERISRVFLSPPKHKTVSPTLSPPLVTESSITNSVPSNDLVSDSRVRARAVLYPVVSKNLLDVIDNVDERLSEATAMRYRSLTIGRGPGNHVDIDKYGKCNFVSSKHAVIFFDEAAQKYELINYSEHGTSVNNILYTCDFTAKVQKPTSILSDIIDKRKAKMAAESSSTYCNNSASGRTLCKCGQGVPSELSDGWEGTAILTHGTLLKFGCVSFVFSITSEDRPQKLNV